MMSFPWHASSPGLSVAVPKPTQGMWPSCPVVENAKVGVGVGAEEDSLHHTALRYMRAGSPEHASAAEHVSAWDS